MTDDLAAAAAEIAAVVEDTGKGDDFRRFRGGPVGYGPAERRVAG
ncbi:hypothetical protein [Streptomyces sp. NPDC102282]